jgi:flagellar hook-basal body complex protein FliE
MTPINELYNVSSGVIQQRVNELKLNQKTDSFDKVLAGAMNMLDETNGYFNKVSEEEVRFELGQALNTHDLQIAQEKASITLQYTMAVRDRVIAAYKELMQMQI